MVDEEWQIVKKTNTMNWTAPNGSGVKFIKRLNSSYKDDCF